MRIGSSMRQSRLTASLAIAFAVFAGEAALAQPFRPTAGTRARVYYSRGRIQQSATVVAFRGDSAEVKFGRRLSVIEVGFPEGAHEVFAVSRLDFASGTHGIPVVGAIVGGLGGGALGALAGYKSVPCNCGFGQETTTRTLAAAGLLFGAAIGAFVGASQHVTTWVRLH